MAHPWEQRWTLGDRLGKGGQGVTYAATFNEDNTVRGALKYLRNNRDEQARGRMRREVANLETLASAGGAVPRVLDHNTGEFGNSKVELYVVMDHINGPTLTEYVKIRGALSFDQAIRFTLSIIRTISIAHTFLILHRDLKPDNIIVRSDEKPELVVVDYGLSFNALDEALTETDETFRNQFLDLPETNPPSGDRRDPRSDLTATCAILYYCLTGHVPGQLQDASGTLPHLRQGFSLRDFHDADERIQTLNEFLTRGFAPTIANRFQSVEEMQERLVNLLNQNARYDATDPIQLAAVLSNQLRARDRITQIGDFRHFSQSLFEHISQEAVKYSNKLGRFTVKHVIGGPQPRIVMPAGLDLVQVYSQTIILSVAHHDLQRHRKFVVASQGERCVLLVANYSVNAKTPQSITQLALEWNEVAWYEGDPESIFSLVSISYREWITSQLQELANEILSTG